MRSLLLTVAASAGLGLSLLTASPANAIAITTPMGVRQTADALGLSEAVHCRRYQHWHKNGHDWSRGCGGDPVAIDPPGARGFIAPLVGTPSGLGRSPGNYVNPSNPQDRSGSSNRQDMTQPRAINPQDMR
jgi:hypothetical protein